MKIQYVVANKVFTSKNDAIKYENSIIRNTSKFYIGQLVFFINKRGYLEKAIVSDICKQFGKICYKLNNTNYGKMESSLFGSLDEYFYHVVNELRN